MHIEFYFNLASSVHSSLVNAQKGKRIGGEAIYLPIFIIIFIIIIQMGEQV